MNHKNHDILFKKTLQQKENAIDYLQNELPENILKELELSSLEIAKDSFIDQADNDIHSDILFKVMFRGKPGYIYLLLEHKSYPDRFTAFQLLKYMVGIWDLHLKQSKGEKLMLPIILPMVLYHGETEWKFGKDFLSIQEKVEVLEKYQVNFSYILQDLSKQKDEDIKGEIINRIFLLLFKYIHSDNIEEKFLSILDLLVELEGKQTGLEYIEIVIRYLFNSSEKIRIDKVKTMIEDTRNRRIKNIMPTIADSLRKEGYDIGLQESRFLVNKAEAEKQKAERKIEIEKKRAERKEKLRIAISMKKKGFSIDQITNITELETKFLEKLFQKLDR